MDYIEAKEFKMMRFIDTQVCATFKSMMGILKLIDNKFLKITNNKGEEGVVYSKDGMIYLPECTEIISFNFKTTNECFKELPVIFKFNNENKIGFMNSNTS